MCVESAKSALHYDGRENGVYYAPRVIFFNPLIMLGFSRLLGDNGDKDI